MRVPVDMPRATLRGTGRAAGLFLLLAVALTWPAVTTFTTRLAGDGGDGFQVLWGYWWLKEALVQGANPFFTDHLHHPFGVTLVFQTWVLPDALMALPLWAVLPPVAVFNTMLLVSFVLTGLGMWALVREWTGDERAALFAGAAFMAMPFHTAHALGHQHLVALGYLPLYVLFFLRLARGGTWRDAVLGAVCLAAASTCSWYQLIVAAVWTLGLTAWALRTHRATLLSRRFAQHAAILAVVFLALVGPLLWAMYRHAAAGKVEGGHDPHEFVADLESFWLPGGRQLWGQWLTHWQRWTGNESENGNQLGLIVLALAVIGMRHERAARYLGATALVGALLALGAGMHVGGTELWRRYMPYNALVLLLPPLKLSGAPVRFVLVAEGALILAAAFGLAHLCRARAKGWRLALAATALMLLEFWPRPLPTTVWPVPPPMRSWAARDGGAVLDLSGGTRMLWHALHHGRPCIGGYITRAPGSLEAWYRNHPVLGHLRAPHDHFGRQPAGRPGPLGLSREAALATLRAIDLRYVVVPDGPRDPVLDDALALPVLWRGGDLRILAVPPHGAGE